MNGVKLSALLLTIEMSACHDAPPRIAIVTRAPVVVATAVPSFTPSTAPSAPIAATTVFVTPSSNTVALATWSKREPEHWTGFGKMAAHSPNSGRHLGDLPLRAQRVHAVVMGGIARTEVEAEFQNDRRSVVEGQLTFPLPRQATLSRLATWAGSEWRDGQVVDDDQRYHVPQGKLHSEHWRDAPKLIGSHGGEIFLAVVFPIAANANTRLLLAYDQGPPKLNGREIYRFPMSMDLGNRPSVQDFAIEVTLLGIVAERSNITTPGYTPEVRREADRTIVRFQAQQFRPERDFLIEVEQPDASMVAIAAMVPSWGKAAPQHALFARPRPEFSAAQDPAKPLGHFEASVRLATPNNSVTTRTTTLDRVVVVDKSYSQSATTLEIERRIVKELLERSKPNEHVTILACDSVCERWPGNDNLEVMTWLNRLAPSGASDLEGAIATAALALTPGRPSQIIWLSDGLATVGELDPKRLSKRIARWTTDKSIDLRLIGVGERLDENFLTSLAKSVDATYDMVTTDSAIEQRVTEVANAISEPKLTELRVAFPSGTQDVYPKTWPAMRLGQTLTIVGRVTAPVHGVLHMTGKWGGRDYTQDVPIAIEPATIAPNPLVGRLFAAQQIREVESCLDHARLEFGMSEFARSARLASRHTGWLLVDPIDNTSRHRPAGILPLRPAGISSDNIYRSTTQTFDWSRARVTPGRFAISGYVRIGPIVTTAIGQLRTKDADLSPIRGWLEHCYTESLLVSGDWSQGLQQWLMRIAPSGRPESIAVEGMRTALGAEFAECVRQEAIFLPLNPVAEESIELRFAAETRIDWSRGTAIWPIDMSVPQSRDWGPLRVRTELPIDITIRASNQDSRTANPTEHSTTDAGTHSAREARQRSLLKTGQFAQALAEAERCIAADPDDQSTLELMAMTAGAIQDKSRSAAALEALLELRPDDDNVRLTAAQAYLSVGDERRACAHFRGIRSKSDEVLANALRCRYRWFREGHTPIAEAERLDVEASGVPQPRFWQVANDITKGADIAAPAWQVSECHDFRVFVHCDQSPSRCPEAIVVTPTGDVISTLVPMFGKGLASPLAFWMKTAGTYRVLLSGGEKNASGTVEVRIAGESAREFRFSRGATLQTVATAAVRSNEHSPAVSGDQFCLGG